MDIIFKGRHTNVPERFRRHAEAKLSKIGKLDQKAIRVDVEVSKERNPRQSDRRERVELTILSRGPAIRAEAAADDRYTALDLAFAKLESRLRRACDRRKVRRAAVSGRAAEAQAAPAVVGAAVGAQAVGESAAAQAAQAAPPLAAQAAGAGEVRGDRGNGRENGGGGQASAVDGLVPIQMEGDGPLVVREKVHTAQPMTIDQALLEMELVGHDFYLFHDRDCDRFSVVYRRRGYDYGVIRLVEELEE